DQKDRCAHRRASRRQTTGLSFRPERIALMQPDREILLELMQGKMPFGKYKGRAYRAVPVSYLEWMHREGFPKGRSGMLLATLYEIRINGLDFLLDLPGRNSAIRGAAPRGTRSEGD